MFLTIVISFRMKLILIILSILTCHIRHDLYDIPVERKNDELLRQR